MVGSDPNAVSVQRDDTEGIIESAPSVSRKASTKDIAIWIGVGIVILAAVIGLVLLIRYLKRKRE